MYSSYIRPNHHVNVNANSGDFVSEIVENSTSGQQMNTIMTSSRAHGPAGVPGYGATEDTVGEPSVLFARRVSHGILKKRFAADAQQKPANSHWRAARTTRPASFEPVKYREIASAPP